MTAVCFYFQAHQPYRVKDYRYADIGRDHSYFNEASESNRNNERILKKVAAKCYLPANEMLLSLLQKHPEFKVSFSISGTTLEQFAAYEPEVLDSFRRLVDTGRVELLNETYYHSLSFLHSMGEFAAQIRLHQRAIESLFGISPTVYRNTELIYRNDIADTIAKMGYQGMLAEGADHILGWRSPNFLYHAKGNPDFGLLLKNYRLSDDIAFRFGERSWAHWPLTAPTYASWISSHNYNSDEQGEVINLFMDYETIGEHQWSEGGIFDFMYALPGEILKEKDNYFVTPSEAFTNFKSVGEFDVPDVHVSWADTERDLSAWRSNPIQHDALKSVYALEAAVKATKNSTLLEDWRRLTTSDHFYYMCTKWFNDGDVHKYFSPYESPYEAFIAYMNAIEDVRLRTGETPPSFKSFLLSYLKSPRALLQSAQRVYAKVTA